MLLSELAPLQHARKTARLRLLEEQQRITERLATERRGDRRSALQTKVAHTEVEDRLASLESKLRSAVANDDDDDAAADDDSLSGSPARKRTTALPPKVPESSAGPQKIFGEEEGRDVQLALIGRKGLITIP